MSNNDNAMARFLFAILKQKNLKDIDWNKVAHDPILTQEISNGHAARMRYSRFRASMLGLEPQRRNKTKDKNRVTKPKSRSRRSEAPENIKIEDEDANVKHDHAIQVEQNSANTIATPSPTVAAMSLSINMGSRIIKQESQHSQVRYDAHFLPTPEALSQINHHHHHSQSPSLSHAHLYSHPNAHHTRRLLTPSSETDGMHPTPPAAVPRQKNQPRPQIGAGSPDSLLSTTGFDVANTVCANEPPPSSWGSTGTQGYSANFDAAFYPPPSSGEQCVSTHGGNTEDMMLGSGGNHTIKNEDWATHFPPI